MQEEYNKASAWFNDLYKKNKNTQENIPWARLTTNPLLENYLLTSEEHKGKALVIGCGLGDDAIALEKAGFDVIAIDVSQAALDLARERFPQSKVEFIKQDIFDMPKMYYEYFDFVFESSTIQSLPIEFRERMIKAIANCVAKNAHLLLIAYKKENKFTGPPWPLTIDEVNLFQKYGLKELSHKLRKEESKISNTRFEVLYVKPI